MGIHCPGGLSEAFLIQAGVDKPSVVCDPFTIIYIEYIQRKTGVDYEIFTFLGDQSWWTGADSGGDDDMVAQLGRTLRLGPDPGYMAIWRCRGMDKLDEWERYFSSSEALQDRHGQASHRAITFAGAGCYDELLTGPAIGNGLQYIEYFVPDNAIPSQQVTGFFSQREQQVKDGTLHLVLQRIGLLGPDPGGMAIWSFPDFACLETIARQHLTDAPVSITSAGTYRRWGREIL